MNKVFKNILILTIISIGIFLTIKIYEKYPDTKNIGFLIAVAYLIFIGKSKSLQSKFLDKFSVRDKHNIFNSLFGKNKDAL